MAAKKPTPTSRSSGASRWFTFVLWVGAGVMLSLGIQSVMKRGVRSTVPGATDDPSRPVSFSKDIAPILYGQCAPCHHPGDAAPFSILSFADAQKRVKQIAEVTRRRLMPPWLPAPGYNEFVGQRYLSEREIALIQRWAEQGAPEGDAAEAPPSPVFPESSWKLGKPDLVIQLPEPYTLAADGKDVYRNFVIPVPISSQRFVRAVELNPGNAKAVHHAFMLLDPSRDSRRRDALDAEPGFPGLHTPPSAQTPPGHFLSWQPGKLPTRDADEFSWVLEPDTDFILQMHLRPTGKPERVQPSVAFYFSDQPPTRALVKFGLWTHDIDIPAGATNYLVNDSYTLPAPVELMRVLPHTHYLGKELRAWATLPDGTQRWLLNIPSWDFNWQGDYTYQKPVALPKGATIHMSYAFDNSTNNPVNPSHPPRRVRYGANSEDEMAELWLQVLTRSSNDTALIEKDYQPRVFRGTISYNTYLLGQDPDNAKAHTEIGKAYLFLGQLDDSARFLRRAVELKPDEDESHYFLGLLWRVSGRLADAQKEFETTVRLNPNHQKAHGNLGLVHLQEGRIPEAEVHLRAALLINPADEVARKALGDIESRRGAK